MATCSSCGAKIRFVVMPSGKRMPLDAEPVAVVGDEHSHTHTATVSLCADKEGGQMLTKDQLQALPVGTPLYRSHFATCPNSAAHRKQRQRLGGF